MKEVNITITSKNQITLPAEYVRHMKLSKSRQLTVRRRGNDLIMTPVPTLEESMQKYWGRHSAKQPVSDRDLKQAVREAVSRSAG